MTSRAQGWQKEETVQGGDGVIASRRCNAGGWCPGRRRCFLAVRAQSRNYEGAPPGIESVVQKAVRALSKEVTVLLGGVRCRGGARGRIQGEGIVRYDQFPFFMEFVKRGDAGRGFSCKGWVESVKLIC